MALLSVLFAALLISGANGAPARMVFLGAGLLTALASLKGGWANGIFTGLLFNFTYYAFRGSGGTGQLVVNSSVCLALALLADRAKPVAGLKEEKKEEKDGKAFVNKIINSFMLGHGMVTEIKKGLSRQELLALYARNIFNLAGADHVLYYSSGQQGDGAMELEFSAGKYQESVIESRPGAGNPLKTSRKNCPADALGLVKGARGNAMVMPIDGTGSPSGAAVLFKSGEFSYSDIYVVEFFSAQVFIIMEKQELLRKMSGNYERIIEALAIAIDTKDHETHGHSLATMQYAVSIAEKMGLSEEEKARIRYAALLHDIGKIGISNTILNKPEKLTSEEFEIIKKHPEYGVNILKKLGIFDEILPLVMHHHEHYNGKGYPKNLSGKDIPLGSRICSIADAYSVMMADRPYRKARSRGEAISELKRCSGTQFDSEIVDVFLDVIAEGPDAQGRGQVN